MTTRKSNERSPRVGGGGSHIRAMRVRVLFSTASLALKRLLERIGQQLEEDANGLLQMSYQQRIEFQSMGESKGATLVHVAFKPDGKPLITPISAPEASGSRQRAGLLGALQDVLAPDAMREVDGLVKLSNAYLFLTSANRQALIENSEVSILPAEGIVKLVAKDLLQHEDQVVCMFDGKTGRQVQMSVETSTRRCPVTVVATYQTLPSGLTTFAQADITVTARELNIRLNTMNYQQQ